MEKRNESGSTGMFNQFVMFSGVGFVGTSVHFASLVVLVFLTVPALIATSIGAVAGASVNYLLNRRYTFQSDRAHRYTLPRFFTVAAVGWALNGIVFEFLLNSRLHYLAAQIGATAVVLLWGFLMNRLWTFSGERSYGK